MVSPYLLAMAGMGILVLYITAFTPFIRRSSSCIFTSLAVFTYGLVGSVICMAGAPIFGLVISTVVGVLGLDASAVMVDGVAAFSFDASATWIVCGVDVF